MEQPSSHEITQLLQAWSAGDQSAYERLIPLIHHELHRLASHYLRQEQSGHILQTTALVNEIYLKLIEWRDVSLQDRKNFFGVAAMLMRRVLVDYARRYPDLGARMIRLDDPEAPDIPHKRRADLVALDDALKSLAEMDERKSRIVELRFFGGLNVEEAAEVLGVSPRTVAREWSLAQAWLYHELTRENGKGEA
jgi:RNA polymerase sigma factor (TIGR02999 family)